MKDITLKITGKQCFDGKEEDQLEFVTDGQIYERNDALYIIYDESEVNGFNGCKTSLKIKDNTVKMKRIGEVGYGTELYFEVGKRFHSSYETPYGDMPIEVLTSMITNTINKESLKGEVNVEYTISLNGKTEGKNRLLIEVNN